MVTTIGLALLFGHAGTSMGFAPKSAVVYPWSFTNGTSTSRATVKSTLIQIEQKAGYAALPSRGMHANGTPSSRQLLAYGKKAGANVVLYGSVNWHTRSIWVGAGPKTISTATVNAYVFSVKQGKTVYSKRGVQGRSDERDSDLKLVADVLLTPVVSAVSGGPATPREQRAVQIAIAKAYHDWVSRHAMAR